MVVSDQLLFIHIPKTGGMSCREWLVENVPSAVHPLADPRITEMHTPLRDVERVVGRSLDSFEKIIAVVRDPYEQQLSMWRHQRSEYAMGGRHPLQLAAATKPDMESWLRDPACDWRLWYELSKFSGGWNWGPWRQAQEMVSAVAYYEYSLTVDGEVPGNLVLLRFDELPASFLGEVQGYAVPDSMPFPHHNFASRHLSARPFFSDLARQLIRHRFRWCFQRGLFKEWR